VLLLNFILPAIVLKLLLIFFCAAALFFFLRAISSSKVTADSGSGRSPRLDDAKPERAVFHSATLSNGKEAPIADDLGRVCVTRLNFLHFDAMPGPPDPECFVDELIVELLDPVEDYRWTVTFVVATPAGIRKLMDDERWSFFYSTEIFIVRRYDFPTIRQAVYGRIKEIHEDVGLQNRSGNPPVVG
jgi:hypothetical protein